MRWHRSALSLAGLGSGGGIAAARLADRRCGAPRARPAAPAFYP
jgi:hypothetical protein